MTLQFEAHLLFLHRFGQEQTFISVGDAIGDDVLTNKQGSALASLLDSAT